MLGSILILLFAGSGFSQTGRLKGELALISLKQNGETISLPVSKPRAEQIIINFYAKGSYSLQAACNSITGKYATTGKGNFKFTNGQITAMFCSKEANNFDSVLSGALSKTTKYQLNGKTLILRDKTGSNTPSSSATADTSIN